MNRWLRRGLITLAVLGTPVLWLAPPIYPYRVACGEYLQHPFRATLRPIFIEQLREGFAREQVPYVMLFGHPYLTWLGSFDSLNWEIGYAFRIASGQTRQAPPPAIRRLVAAWEAEHGERLARYPNGEVDFRAFEKLDECAVKRAALTYADGD